VLANGLFDGLVVSVPAIGLKLTATDPMRPLMIAAAAGALYVWASGWGRARLDGARLIGRLGPAPTAVMLALAVTGVSFAWNSWAVGGSDQYVYLTQADQWLAGNPALTAPIAADAPWPDALATVTPHGYHPSPTGIVLLPMVAPGLPIIMAAFKAVAGHAAAFWIAPLTGGLLIWATFLVGRRIGSAYLGLGAAWLMATSPTVLLMSRSLMSDVPVTAFWTLSTGCLLGTSAWSAGAAGLLASVAILIRPNLVPLAAAMAAWCAWNEWFGPDRRITRTLWFCSAVIPGCLGVAWYNQHQYGSPVSSGYGNLALLFAWSNVAPNLSQYANWLSQTQTPAWLIGLAALMAPSRRWWPTARARRASALLLAVAIVTCAAYAGYQPFDAWWYLRFLLPALPAISLGLTAVAVFAVAHERRWRMVAATVGVLAIGGFSVAAAIGLGVYPAGEGERRYATVAQLVARQTEPSAVIITGQHAGAMRYYGGRLTLRFDVLDPAWLDRAEAWLGQRGRHVYILLEDWERPAFERRFGPRNRLGRLELDPVLAYAAAQIPGQIYLYDPRRPVGPTLRPAPSLHPRPRCPLPAPPVPLTLVQQ